MTEFRPATDEDLNKHPYITGYLPIGIQSLKCLPDGFKENFFPWKDYFGHGFGKFYFIKDEELFLITEHTGYFCAGGNKELLAEFCQYLNHITNENLFREGDLK